MKTQRRYWRLAEAMTLALMLAFLAVGTVRGAVFVDDPIAFEIGVEEGCEEDEPCEGLGCEEGCIQAFGQCRVVPGTDGAPNRNCHYNHCSYPEAKTVRCVYYCYLGNPCPAH
jgi:hypothetical protein